MILRALRAPKETYPVERSVGKIQYSFFFLYNQKLYHFIINVPHVKCEFVLVLSLCIKMSSTDIYTIFVHSSVLISII